MSIEWHPSFGPLPPKGCNDEYVATLDDRVLGEWLRWLVAANLEVFTTDLWRALITEAARRLNAGKAI
jgi:hypothetical protein